MVWRRTLICSKFTDRLTSKQIQLSASEMCVPVELAVHPHDGKGLGNGGAHTPGVGRWLPCLLLRHPRTAGEPQDKTNSVARDGVATPGTPGLQTPCGWHMWDH